MVINGCIPKSSNTKDVSKDLEEILGDVTQVANILSIENSLDSSSESKLLWEAVRKLQSLKEKVDAL